MGARYRDKKDYDRAIHFYNLINQKWSKTDSAFWATFETGKVKIEVADHNGVQVAMDRMITDFNDHPSLAVRLACLGDEYFYDRNYPKAIDIWKLVLNDYPGQGPTMIAYLLGSAHERLKDYAAAARYYEQSVAEYPKCRYAYRVPYRLGLVCRTMGEYDKAIEWFKRQRTMHPENEMYVDRSLSSQAATYYYDLKDYEKAAETYEQYITEFPDDMRISTMYLYWARCHAKLGRTDWAEAVLEAALVKLRDSERAETLRNELEGLQKGAK